MTSFFFVLPPPPPPISFFSVLLLYINFSTSTLDFIETRYQWIGWYIPHGPIMTNTMANNRQK